MAIADGMDSLVGLFSVNLMPKATADPFALRRAALGFVQIMIANELATDIMNVVRICAEEYIDEKKTMQNVVTFVEKRLEAYSTVFAG